VSEVRLKVPKPLRYWNLGFESRAKYVKLLIFLLSEVVHVFERSYIVLRCRVFFERSYMLEKQN